jgi:hypothetical protein
MVRGTVVAIEAGAVGSFYGKNAGLLNVAGGTLFFKNGMCPRQAAGAVDAGIAGQALFGDPKDSQQREKEAEPELGPLERRRPLEIVQVDALGKLFGCAGSRHNLFRANSSQLKARAQKGKQNPLAP